MMAAPRKRHSAQRLSWLENRRLELVAVWLLLCLSLGGASNAGSLANLVLQLAAAGIIAWHILRGNLSGRISAAGRDDMILLILLGAAVGWIVLTLIPLPPALWTRLPGRVFVADGYRLLGFDLPWLPISLADDRTVRSLLSLLVPVSTYLVVRPLAVRQRAWLAVVAAGFAVASTALGMAQLAGGENSPLRLYDITNRTEPVGLFANANHLATLLLVMMPLIAAALPMVSERPKRGPNRAKSRFAWSPVATASIALFLTGLVLIGSNAGLMLALPALAGGLLLGPLQPLMARPIVRRALGLGIAAVMGLAVIMIFTGQFQQKIGVSATSRQAVTGTTLRAAVDYMPVGSGLGSFSAIYLKQSGGEKSAREWMNHAHDDLAEVVLELGAAGVVLMALFAFWLFGRAWQVWLRDPRTEGLPLVRAGSLGAVIVVLHSMADYPLRSAAIAALFAMLLALIAERPAEQPGEAAGEQGL